jgi:hypothetical protein
VTAPLRFNECWPKLADSVDVAKGTLYVYGLVAIFSPSHQEGEDADLVLDTVDIANLRAALEWAERRLASR